MPASLRPNNKAKKIAEKIMGVAVNGKKQKNIKRSKINERLNYEESRLSK